MKKLKNTRVECYAQGHAARMKHSWDMNLRYHPEKAPGLEGKMTKRAQSLRTRIWTHFSHETATTSDGQVPFWVSVSSTFMYLFLPFLSWVWSTLIPSLPSFLIHFCSEILNSWFKTVFHICKGLFKDIQLMMECYVGVLLENFWFSLCFFPIVVLYRCYLPFQIILKCLRFSWTAPTGAPMERWGIWLFY